VALERYAERELRVLLADVAVVEAARAVVQRS